MRTGPFTSAIRRLSSSATRVGRAVQDRTLGRWYYARLPLDPSLVAYTSGWHRAPRGNPLAVFEAQQRLAPEFRAVWIVRAEDEHLVPAGVTHVRPRTLAALKVEATARAIIDDSSPYWSVRAPRGQVYVQTHHGTALKYMGADRTYSGDCPANETITTMHRRCQRWTYSLSTSEYLTEVWQRAYACDATMLATGFPRNDRLLSATDNDRAQARARLGLGEDDVAVLYMPTWRDRAGVREQGLDVEAVAAALPAHLKLLVRDHYYHDHTRRDLASDKVTDVSEGWQVEDLYLASDALVTDYSSAMFDYCLLDRPIVLLCDDWDDYRQSRGAYFDITADAPGQVVMTADALVESLDSGTFAARQYAQRRASFRERFATYEGGTAAEAIVRIALLGESPGPWIAPPPTATHPAGWTTHPPVRPDSTDH
ncbi:CDP-glycerol glycerophosphotransferase family protein [Demequina sp.]|uniref:CDP-glycerol glycerophosphotransferase family protein n=1 Tax=Demequina sp. TaxID=2050685 RepID=UPI003A86747E